MWGRAFFGMFLCASPNTRRLKPPERNEKCRSVQKQARPQGVRPPPPSVGACAKTGTSPKGALGVALGRKRAEILVKMKIESTGQEKAVGVARPDKVNKTAVKSEFSNKIVRLTKSKAYLDFCEEVYGYRMYLFNMMDKQQLDFVFNYIPITSDDTVLDLGCGSGSILNRLVQKYGCNGIGIDQLDADVVEGDGNTFTYIEGDIDEFIDYDVNPSITLSIDSLYFSNDLDRLLRNLKSIKNNRMYLFYSQYVFDEISGDRTVLCSNKTRIADVLNRNEISFDVVDYSDNERFLYENALRVMRKYEKAFEEEGNTDLYLNKLKEDMMGRTLYDKGLARRYLYIIE